MYPTQFLPFFYHFPMYTFQYKICRQISIFCIFFTIYLSLNDSRYKVFNLFSTFHKTSYWIIGTTLYWRGDSVYFMDIGNNSNIWWIFMIKYLKNMTFYLLCWSRQLECLLKMNRRLIEAFFIYYKYFVGCLFYFKLDLWPNWMVKIIADKLLEICQKNVLVLFFFWPTCWKKDLLNLSLKAFLNLKFCN